MGAGGIEVGGCDSKDQINQGKGGGNLTDIHKLLILPEKERRADDTESIPQVTKLAADDSSQSVAGFHTHSILPMGEE